MTTIPKQLALAVDHHKAGRLQAAEQIYRQVLEQDASNGDAIHLLGVLAHQVGKHELAVQYIRKAIALNPSQPSCWQNLAEAQRALGDLPQAIASFRRAIHLKPNYVEAISGLATALARHGQADEAIACYRQVLRLKPDWAEVHNNLSNQLKNHGRIEEAVAGYRRALQLKPDYAEAYSNLGNALSIQGNLTEAIGCYRRAVELKPDYLGAHTSLGYALNAQGKLADSIAVHRRAIELKPDYVRAHSNLVFVLAFSPDHDAESILEESLRWNQRHAEPLATSILPHANDRSPDRRLRIGYVSPDFRDHCQSNFTVPLFSSHDHRNFEIFCYSDVPRPDSITERLRSHADNWRSIAGLTDEQAAQTIREDGIDILVDLTMHMADNRLLVFARKPAPVQVCWLAYPGTTGLSAMDYRLTDPYLDPPGLFDRHYAEESIRLPDSFWCYDPLTNEPAVNPLPVLSNGFITFGSFNNFCKVNPGVLKLWARVLRAVDGSRLHILTAEGSHRTQTLEVFEREGVAPDRVTFLAKRPRDRYLACFHDTDIVLDTFPYNGHTTSLDSFWMGVPVVTFVGQTVVGRGGLCQLTNLGLPELIADTPERYVTIAAQLASDHDRLRRLRAGLRQRLQESPLMDAGRFARGIEATYRRIWQRWCAGG
jgi:predicted O-linked N-acetylglucosamine transferase (SPINDLY family)